MEKLPVFCDNTIANSIIGYYYLKAKECGISLESRCSTGGQTVMSDSDLCIVLGNALENALEACMGMGSDEKRFISVLFTVFSNFAEKKANFAVTKITWSFLL